MAQVLAVAAINLNTEKGSITQVAPDGSVWGAKETVPNFVRLNITELLYKDSRYLKDQWSRSIDFVDTTYDLGTGVITGKVTVVNASTVKGGITRAESENVLNNLGLSVTSAISNAVNVTSTLDDILISPGFWGQKKGILSVVMTGLDAVLTYPNTFLTPSYFEELLIFLGVDVTAHDNRIVEFTIPTISVINTHLKVLIQEGVGSVIAPRRYRLPVSIIDNAISNGGSLIMTSANFLAAVVDKQAE